MEVNDCRMMELSDAFMTDPFLTLDSDLDDVSEVIRSNMEGYDKIARYGSTISSVTAAPFEYAPPGCSSGALSCATSCNALDMPGVPTSTPSPHETYDKEERSKQIGHIVSLLQDDTPMLYRPESGSSNGADVKPNTISAAQQLNHDALDTAARLRAFEAQQQQHYHHQQQQTHVEQQPQAGQQFFIDGHSSDVNFAAALRTDSAASSPLDKRDYSHFTACNQPFAPHSDSAAFMANSPDVFTHQTTSGYANALPPMLFDGGTFDPRTMDSDDVFLDGMHESSRVMLHSGLSDEMLHASCLQDDAASAIQFCQTHVAPSSHAHSNSNSMPSPSLSDLFPAGDVFPPAPPTTLSSGGEDNAGNAYFYLDETVSPSPPNAPNYSRPFDGEHFRYPPVGPTVTLSDDSTNRDVSATAVAGVDTAISDDSEGRNANSKSDLIRMLLEMSHTELETLRLSRNNSAVDIAASAMENRAAGAVARSRLQRQQQKASTASLPPLDPPPPAPTTAQPDAQKQPDAQNSAPKRSATKRKTTAKKHSTISVPDEFTLIVHPNVHYADFQTETQPPDVMSTYEMCNGASYFLTKNEESDDDTDVDYTALTDPASTSTNNNTSPTKRGPKTERRTAHNLIEKKYRCSINDRINHLKTMLASDENKLSKSATLRKAIDHINTLRRENHQLRALLDSAGIAVPSSREMPTNGNGGIVPPQSLSMSRQFELQQAASGSSSSSSADSSPVSASPTLCSPPCRVGTGQPPPTTMTNSSNNKSRKRPAFFGQPSQKVTLCIFMFVMVAFNPLSFFISPDASSHNDTDALVPHVYAHHRTLRSVASTVDGGGGGGFTSFDYANASESFGIHGNATFWLKESTVRRCFVWALNALIVVFVLMRLFIYTEPVADRKSAEWREFLVAKQRARLAVAQRNYREAQLQLCDALALIGREIPSAGSVEELFSVAWQIVRHLLNSIWVGRWLARRRRSSTQPSAAVCRSHAATALVYHQIHQLHLIGVNGVELSDLGALNLALAAVNLAESAGISRHGISHRTRADIYVNAALRAKFHCRYFGALSYSYFMRRAKRHVRKAQMVDGADVRSLQWIFHPLGRKFLKSHTDAVTDILRSSRRPLSFPFSDAQISPKPTECLTNAFKMHLLSLLAKQLSALSTSSRGTLTDFVEISHFLLEICTSIAAPPATIASKRNSDASMLDWCSSDYGDEVAAGGDELCTWWAHLITGGLYWRHGDYAHAQKHYAIVRRCPKRLINNDLALSTGLAFCARKMCFDDRAKKNFTVMVWIHAQRSFQHLERDNFPTFQHKNADIVSAIRKCCRAITCEWIMSSLLDVWNNQLHANRPCWQHCSPHLVHQLYKAAYRHFESCDEYADKKKLIAFEVLEKSVGWNNVSPDMEKDRSR